MAIGRIEPLPDRDGHRTRWGFAAFSYACMVGGMGAQGAYSHLTGRSVWNPNTFLIPLTISPMVFSVCIAVIKSEIDILTGAIMAFQNGFFWKQIFDGLGPILKASGHSG